MKPTTACPPNEMLRRYAIGERAAAGFSELEEHLGHCSNCLDQLDELSRDQSFVDAIRRATPVGRSRELERAIATVLGEAAPRRIETGTVLREYRLLEQIGQGGMGTVFRAIHTRLGKMVAVKVIRSGQNGDPIAVARFQREVQAIGQLDHPNIVRATDAGEVDGIHFLVMELIDGVNLSQHVLKNGPLPVKVACRYLLQAAAGLECAHHHGMIHRDVKPSNLILTPDGTVKILDLGLALLPTTAPSVEETNDQVLGSTDDENEPLTASRRMMGTRDYMAPEQRTNPHLANARADVFGLGATLWFLLAGEPLSRSRILDSSLAGNLPKSIWLRLLAHEPEDRYSSAAEVATALRPYADLPRPRGRGFAVAVAVAAAVLLGLLWATRSTRDDLASHLNGSESPPTANELAPPPRVVPVPGKFPLTREQAKELQHSWATYIQRPVSRRNNLGLEFVVIPQGEVELDENTKVGIPHPYEMSTCEVTLKQFREFVNETGYITILERRIASGESKGGHYSSHEVFKLPNGRDYTFKSRIDPKFIWSNPGYPDASENDPVTQVTIDDALAFCRWLSHRDRQNYDLPTEAEWFWSATGGQSLVDATFGGKGDAESGKHAWLYCSSPLKPQPVGRFAPNVFGLFDTFGNVKEMCLCNLGRAIPPGHYSDPVGEADSTVYIVRGAGYSRTSVLPASISQREFSWKKFTNTATGFRVCQRFPLARGNAKPSETRSTPHAARYPMSEVEAKESQKLWSEYAPRNTNHPVLELPFRVIPPGEFQTKERTTFVIQKPFEITTTEITRAQFELFVRSANHQPGAVKVNTTPFSFDRALTDPTGYLREAIVGEYHPTDRNPSEPKANSPRLKPLLPTLPMGFQPVIGHTFDKPAYLNPAPTHPAVYVSWKDATAFCEWLGRFDGRTYRLPTETEWEWAARAGESALYPAGEPKHWPKQLEDIAWMPYKQNARSKRTQPLPTIPSPVGRLKPNAWGLYDMLGNVAEWCLDSEADLPRTGRHIDYRSDGPSPRRVIRGGYFGKNMSLSDREFADASFSANGIGFRVVRVSE